MIDILMGNETASVVKAKDQELKSFSIGKEYDEQIFYSIYRQLIAQGHLELLMDGKSQLKLTRSAIDLIQGRVELFIRADYKKTVAKKATSSTLKTKIVKKKRRKRRKRSY